MKKHSPTAKVLIKHPDSHREDKIVHASLVSDDEQENPEYLIAPNEWQIAGYYDKQRFYAYHEDHAPEGKEFDKDEYDKKLAEGWLDTPASFKDKKPAKKGDDTRDKLIETQESLITDQQAQLKSLQAAHDELAAKIASLSADDEGGKRGRKKAGYDILEG